MKRVSFWAIALASMLGLVVAASGCSLAPGSGGGGGQEEDLVIGTAGEGGTYFYVGQGMATVI